MMATVGARSFTRAAILQRLQDTINRGEPIIAVSAGAGIVAKCAEIAGADLIVVLCSSKSRHLGVPTTVTLGNANSTTLGLFGQIDNVVDRTPVVGGAEATDPTRRRLPGLLQEFTGAGFDGIANFPTVGMFPTWGRARSDVGQGIEREYELVRLARDQDLFSMGMAYSAEHARGLAAAGADVIVARCGLTVGGMTGPKEPLVARADATALVQSIFDAARAENAGVIGLATGGPFVTADDTELLYAESDAQGFLGESSIERIPIEQGVANQARDYKAQPLRPSATR
jgi:predicted TIM-barrel enzyme